MEFSSWGKTVFRADFPPEGPVPHRDGRRKSVPRFSGDGTSAVNEELSGRTAFPL